jgi:hypothetical protein
MHLLCICALRCCFAGHLARMPKKKPQVNGGVWQVGFRLTVCFFGVFFVAKLCGGGGQGGFVRPSETNAFLQAK